MQAAQRNTKHDFVVKTVKMERQEVALITSYMVAHGATFSDFIRRCVRRQLDEMEEILGPMVTHAEDE